MDLQRNINNQEYSPSIEIYIKDSSGQQYSLNFQLSELINKVKEKLFKFSKIEPCDQILIYKGKKLDDNKKLTYYSIKNGEIIYLVKENIEKGHLKSSVSKKLNEEITLLIMKLNGQVITLTCRYIDSINIIKRKIQDLEGIKIENQILIFGRKILENKKTLNDYEIKNKDQINLIDFDNKYNESSIIIKTSTGLLILFSGIPELNVKELKSKIENEFKISKYNQKLFFNDIELINSFIIRDYEINYKKEIFFLSIEPAKEKINFFIQLPSNIKLSLSCGILTTISQIQKKIEEYEGIPSDQQKLYYNKRLLLSENNIQFYGIDTSSVINLYMNYTILKKICKTKIFVKTITGKTLTIFCDLSFKTEDIKLIIEEMEGISPCNQRLIYDRTQLEDDKQLSYYNIENESKIHLVIRLRGGGCGPKITILSGMTFNSMSNLQHCEFSLNGPDWADVGFGLSINGICKNSLCRANDQWVYKTLGYGNFDLRTLINNLSVCPICNVKIQFNNIIFIRSSWYHKAILEDGTKVSTKDNPSFTQLNKYATYLDGDNIQYQTMKIYVKEHHE